MSDKDKEMGEGGDEPVAPVEERITLDRYYSRRRPPVKSGWAQIVSLVAMLAALVMIMVYKDQCGRQVSELMGTVGPPDAGGTPVRYQIPPEERTPKAPQPPQE